MPFNGDTASQLEEEIMLGKIKFREPEWISIGEPGMETYVHLSYMYVLVITCHITCRNVTKAIIASHNLS